MKARVKKSTEIIDVEYKQYSLGHRRIWGYEDEEGVMWTEDDLEILNHEPDYWDRLTHQAAITAMQGIMSNPVGFESIRCTSKDLDKKVAEIAICFAKELVEGLKLIRSN